MLSLNTNKLTPLSIGALLVIAGVVLKNTSEQLKNAPNHPMNTAGMACFVLGWLTVGYAVSITSAGKLAVNARTVIVFACALSILGSVMLMKKAMAAKKQPAPWMPILFAGAWILLGWMTGSSPATRVMGLVAAGCVLVSMMQVLPWQRKNNIVDGAGMPLFVIAWALLAVANSATNL